MRVPPLHHAPALAARALLAGAICLLAGCGAIAKVEPWEKGRLAKPEMQFEQDRLDARYAEHTYSSKEGASGGAGVGGGGCGCN